MCVKSLIRKCSVDTQYFEILYRFKWTKYNVARYAYTLLLIPKKASKYTYSCIVSSCCFQETCFSGSKIKTGIESFWRNKHDSVNMVGYLVGIHSRLACSRIFEIQDLMAKVFFFFYLLANCCKICANKFFNY